MTVKPTPPSQKNKRLIKVNAITQARLIKLLLEGTYTCQELAQETGLHYVTVLQYTRELHRVGAAHIAAWDKDNRGRDVAKIYKLGAGTDKRRHRKTGAEKQVAYRTKKKQLKLMQTLCSAQPAGQTPAPLKPAPLKAA